jgi:TetR/AcrR family transcriptional regulator, transcriptional repressor of bet genes
MKSSIEKIRRRDLVAAAFETFRVHGLNGATVARIGRRAGMSHGIINYYFKSKDELLSAVIRHAFGLILRRAVRLLRTATTPRERVAAIVAANFPAELFTPETASSWLSFYAAVATNRDFEKLQTAFYRHLHTKLVRELVGIVAADDAERIATGISVWIDGLWIRCAMKNQIIEPQAAIRAIEAYIDMSLNQAMIRHRPRSSRPAARNASRGVTKPGR